MARSHKRFAAFFVLLCLFSSLRFGAPILKVWFRAIEAHGFHALPGQTPQTAVFFPQAKFLRKALYPKHVFFILSVFYLVFFLAVRRAAVIAVPWGRAETLRFVRLRSPPALPA